jgi:hypothetical protein
VIRDKQGRARFLGAAMVLWGGFYMKPHNIFDFTPFFPPPQ